MFYALIFISALVLAVQAEDKPTSMFAGDVSKEKNGTVNFDDWLALPEVFSKLDFNADSTPAADDDIEGQIKLRSTRYWGRIYIEGFPQSIQFFRAHFGIEPPMGKKYFVFPENREACEPFTLPTVVDEGRTIPPEEIAVLAHRGTCAFGVKATNVHATGASAFVMINNEPGLEHHPSPDTHDIQLSVTSISQPEGQLLESIWDHSRANGAQAPLTGYIVPINCASSGAVCVPTTVEERNVVDALSHGGTLHIHTQDGAEQSSTTGSSVEYLMAHFGVKMMLNAATDNKFSFAMAKPAEACDDLTNNVKGKVVLVRRGGCPFVRKAEMVQSAGGTAMLVGSKHPYLVRMGVEPRWKGLGVNIPVAMISKQSYSNLFAETIAAPTSTVSFTPHANVTGGAWEVLESLYNGEGWPRTSAYASKKFEELKAANAGWGDRVKTVEEAYAKFNKKEETVAVDGAKSEL